MRFAPVSPEPRARFGMTKVRILITVALAVAAFGTLAAAALMTADKAAAPKADRQAPRQAVRQPSPAENRLTFAAVGDLLAHDSVVANARTDAGYDFYPFYADVAPMMQKADVRFCNQEGPVAGEALGISGYPTFNAPKEFARDASKAGCNLINLANNHMADKGVSGLTQTIDTWQALNPLAIAGANKSAADQQKVSYFEKNGLKVAFLAFTETSNNAGIAGYALNRMDEGLMRRLSAEARKNADLVVVSMHWGTEDSNQVDQRQRAAAALLAEQGVDVIIGTGPHVLQPVEKLAKAGGGETLVWYSIGNFLSTQLEVRQLIGGIALFDAVKKDRGVSVENVRFMPTYMHYEWSAADKAAGRLSARKNLKLYPLAAAADPLARSQLSTTVDVQMDYVKATLGRQVSVIERN